ncbi:LysM peptidoglycan-binding domain-containing protein [Cronobacter malonaticus]|nr:LysM peptidoglycan-binding domain-containing protein [Cronobacter malonaticus]
MSHKFISATHDKKTLTAMYKMADGTIYIRKGGTIPWRLQNPGDVRPNGSNIAEYLQPLRLAIADTANGEFAMFGCEEDGWATKKKLLRTSLYRDCTVSEMAEIYAPKKNGNNPKKYAQYVLKESGVSPTLTLGEMDDATLESVMEAMKTKEGYYNLKETRVEKWIYTTNISLTDGTRPISDCQLKVTLGGCEYDWKTNEYGELPTIAHMSDGMAIEVKATNSRGELETLYSAKVGNQSKNILLKRKFVQYKANTLAQNPKVPREKSQPKQVDYIVQSGDVLSKIAARFDVSVSELVASNGIKDANKIYPGQKIVIYGKKETSPDERQSHSVDLSGQYPPVQLGNTYPLPPYPESIESKDAPGISDSNSSRRALSPQSTRQHSESFPLPPYPDVIDTQGRTGTPSSASSMPAVSATKPKENKEKLETVGGKNSGNGQAHLPVLQGEAPWMLYALQEANNYGGVDESMFPSKHNYHSLSKKIPIIQCLLHLGVHHL